MANVLSICGSLRKGSYNRMVMKLLPALAPSEMAITQGPSFAEFPLYNADIQDSTGFPGPVITLADAIRAADGVIFRTPEYTFSLPGGLKNAIDWLSRLPNQPFAGKPIAIQSASPDPLGGGRVQYDLRRMMLFMDALTLNKPEIFIGNCASKFDDKTGELTDDTTRNFIRQQLEAFAKFIEFGMQRQSAKAQARERILNDDELRAVWTTAEADGGAFGAIVRLCLLTAQRSRKVGSMRWADLDGDEWIIPAELREKDTGGTLVLPEMALAIIRAQPRIGTNPHVFAGRGDGAWQGWGKWKASFDRRVGPDVAPWVIHDLRRTARSLMSRAGMRPDIAERVLGHVIPGVAGVYDRHLYLDEKALALAKLAALIEEIIGERGNVMPLALKKISKVN